ncbi:MAG TPA: HAD-IA family hydrolase [Candidatus Polarisedimenticolia bacterium]|nr:HAD-IA family hydrolase [Candidatus Polarisedimenticolia bacterium]
MTGTLRDGVRGIVFDLDGTLIDSYEAIAESLNAALETLGRPALPPAAVRSMVGRGLETLIARALDPPEGAAASPADVARAVAAFRARYDAVCVPRTTLLPGVAVTLAGLHARGYRMGVATNKPSYFARRILDALGVGDLMSSVYGPDRVTHHKPHPEMVHALLASIGLPAAHALYVGDMEVDVLTARAAGLRVAVLPTGSCSRADLERAGADAVLPTFASLLDLLPGPALESASS